MADCRAVDVAPAAVKALSARAGGGRAASGPGRASCGYFVSKEGSSRDATQLGDLFDLDDVKRDEAVEPARQLRLLDPQVIGDPLLSKTGGSHRGPDPVTDALSDVGPDVVCHA